MNWEREFVSAKGIPVVMEVTQVLNHRNEIIGHLSEIRLQYGEGGKGKIFICNDTRESALILKKMLENFLDDRTISGKEIKGK